VVAKSVYSLRFHNDKSDKILFEDLHGTFLLTITNMATMRNWPIQLITPGKCITGNYAKKLDQESRPIHLRLKFADNKMSTNLIRFLNNIW